MKQKIISLLLCLVLLFTLCPAAAFAHSEDLAFENELASDLKALGLFQGVSETNFALGRAPTRTEALVMLIRTLGVEKDALAGGWSHPFTDVASWAGDYVGYAYQNKLTDGVSADRFGTSNASAAMYLTFVLRALGYSDDGGLDFTWDNPYALARRIGILPAGTDLDQFMRSDVVLVSYAALGARIKGSENTLADKLIEDGAFTREQYDQHIDLAKVGITSLEALPAETELNAKLIFQKCADAVFYIEMFDEYGWCTSTGSGFFVGPNGLAVTNNHVIAGASSAVITMTDGTKHKVEGIYESKEAWDLALIKIEGSGYPTVAVGNSGAIMAGENIFAIGSPLGYDNTISAGIISNVRRPMGEVNYIQFTAAISSGSSGGALINEYGQVIGVTSSSSIFGEVSQNVNFAVPIKLIDKLNAKHLTNLQGYKPSASTSGAPHTGSLLVSSTELSIGKGETLTFMVEETYEGLSTIFFSPNNDPVFKGRWGEWMGSTIPLFLTGQQLGTTTLHLELKDEDSVLLDALDITITVTSEGIKPAITFSNGNPIVKAGSSIVVNVSQNTSDEVKLRYNTASDTGVECSWGSWQGDTIPLTVTGVRRGRFWIQIELLDAATEEVLTTKNLYVNVI